MSPSALTPGHLPGKFTCPQSKNRARQFTPGSGTGFVPHTQLRLLENILYSDARTPFFVMMGSPLGRSSTWRSRHLVPQSPPLFLKSQPRSCASIWLDGKVLSWKEVLTVCRTVDRGTRCSAWTTKGCSPAALVCKAAVTVSSGSPHGSPARHVLPLLVRSLQEG